MEMFRPLRPDRALTPTSTLSPRLVAPSAATSSGARRERDDGAEARPATVRLNGPWSP
jgi:hypothetical protein